MIPEVEPSRRLLGQGNSGEVVAVRSRSSGERFAVKALRLTGASPQQLEEFINEVEILLCMDHPHVVRLVEVYESVDQLSLVMECMEGGELFAHFGSQVCLSEDEVRSLVLQMLSALNYIHGQGVVHRDLKLENFLFDRKGGVTLKLVDFGFGRRFEKGEAMAESLGTLRYAAPEVLARSYVAGSCDLWSLGVAVFALLGGYMPFESVSAIRRCKYVMKERWADVSTEGYDFVRRILTVAPASRPTAAQALLHPWLARRTLSGHEEWRHEAQAEAATLRRHAAAAFESLARAPRWRRAVFRAAAWSLGAEERAALSQAFVALDDDCCGMLRIEDLQRVPKEAAAPDAHRDHGSDDESPESVESPCAVLWELDVRGSGQLTYSDFLAAMLAATPERYAVALGETFHRFDLGTSYLESTCLASVMVPASENSGWIRRGSGTAMCNHLQHEAAPRKVLEALEQRSARRTRGRIGRAVSSREAGVWLERLCSGHLGRWLFDGLPLPLKAHS